MHSFSAVVLGGEYTYFIVHKQNPDSPDNIKIILLHLFKYGNERDAAGGVGKSALTVRFMKHTFAEGYDPTIEGDQTSPVSLLLGPERVLSPETYRKSITVDGELCQLEVLDTAGAEQFTALNEFYIRVRGLPFFSPLDHF